MNATRRLSLIEIINLNAYWFGLSFMWNSLHQLVLPAILLNYVPETQKNTYLGLLTFVGLIIAMVIQPISGRASDRWVSRWGRRRPLIFVGTAFDFVFLAILALAGGLFWVALGYLALQFSSNVAHGPAQGLMPDLVPEEQLGSASGIKVFTDFAGQIISYLVIILVLDSQAPDPTVPIVIVSVILAACAAWTLLGAREKPSTREQQAAQSAQPVQRSAAERQQAVSYGWLIASRFIFLLGIYDIQAFAFYYIRDVISEADPVMMTGILLAAISVALMAFGLIGGRQSDRIGHKKLLVFSSVITAVGCVLLLFARDPVTLILFGSVTGAGVGMYITSNWALANQLAPKEEAGKYLGLTNIATAGAGAMARLAGPFIDIVNNAFPGKYWGYSLLFILAAVFALLSLVLLRRVTTRAERAAAEGA